MELEKKLERERLLAEEEAAIGAKKPTLKGVDKKAAQKSASLELFQKESEAELPEFSASGLDGALELMSLATTADNLKASERLDRHPERRVKSAYAAFEERELPILKAENPGLRLTQLKQQLQKTWKKSPENPMVRRPLNSLFYYWCHYLMLCTSFAEPSTYLV